MEYLKRKMQDFKDYSYRNYVSEITYDQTFTQESQNIILNRFYKSKINFIIFRLIMCSIGIIYYMKE